MHILGIPIDFLSRKDALEKARGFMLDDKFHQIATVGPEFLLEAKENEAFKKALLVCDMRVSDGFGITLAHWLRGKRAPERYPGANLMLDLLNFANEKELLVFLACRADGLSSYKEIQTMILKKFPNIRISGSDIDPKASPTAFHYKLSPVSYHLLLCNFGAPEQELFLASLKGQRVIGLTMGVGGSFDYLTGKQKRAPKFMRALGFEWVWRLAMQPRRWRRILRATSVFLLRLFNKDRSG